MSHRFDAERNIEMTGEVAVVHLDSMSERYVYHDGQRIRCVERVDVGDVPQYRGPRAPDLDTRERWFDENEYEEVSVRDVPAPVEAMIRESR